MKTRIGIIGCGVVGGAMLAVMRGESYDIEPGKSTTGSLDELLSRVDCVFICVPTPMAPDGAANVSIVESVVRNVRALDPAMPIAVRSTVPPGTCERLGVVFNPEFLTERQALQDMQNPSAIYLGGDDNGFFEALYREHFTAPIVHMTRTQAELFKYAHNVAGAARVAFANEVWQVCQALGEDYNQLAVELPKMPTLQTGHWQVPGPDGRLGFGGACFPKDVNAWVRVCEALQIEPAVSKAAWSKSCELRK